MTTEIIEEEGVWVDFEHKKPKRGQKIKVLRQMEFEALWDGKEATKIIPDTIFGWTLKTFWKSCDR